MHIETHGQNVVLTPELKSQVELRVWRVANAQSAEVSWAGIRFTARPTPGDLSRTFCQVDAWVRGTGLVSVEHAATDPYAALDGAAARLQHVLRSNRMRSVVGKVGSRSLQAGQQTARGEERSGSNPLHNANEESSAEIFLDYDPVRPDWPAHTDRWHRHDPSMSEPEADHGTANHAYPGGFLEDQTDDPQRPSSRPASTVPTR